MSKQIYTKAFSKILHEFIRPEIRIVIVQGGAASSKTYSIMQLLEEIATTSKKRNVISVTSETFPHLARGSIRDYINILGENYSDKMHNKTSQIFNRGNSFIEFFSCDQSDKVRGPRRDYLFINEANNISRETFTQLEIRTNKKIIIDFNPVCEFWAHEMLARPDVAFLKLVPSDNECINENVLKSMMLRAEIDPNFKRVYIDGEIGLSEGIIFPNIILIDEMPENFEKERCGLDFGFSNHPSALIKVLLQENSLYIDELIYETGLTTPDIIKRMNDLGVSHNDKIIADCAEPKTIEEISREGFYIHPCYKPKDSISSGIDKMKSFHLKVTKRSTNAIKEFRNYSWAYDKLKDRYIKNKPIDNWNHGIDAIRYAVTDMFESEANFWSLSA